MAQIKVSDLTFCYEGSYDNIFEHVSFIIDTDWKLGFIGRNGRGKTTFLNLLLGKYGYKGEINTPVTFDYFPFMVEDETVCTLTVIKQIIAPFAQWEREMAACLADGSKEALEEYGNLLDLYEKHDGYQIEELIQKEAAKLAVPIDTLTRPFSTLSFGERTKLMLSGLFLKKNNFLLIDEPTNHLDVEGRNNLAEYLSTKKGFLLVSHDRAFLDRCINHVLSINKTNIEVQKGNYSSWQLNKDMQDTNEIERNKKLKKDILRLEESVKKTVGWSDKVERSKIGCGVADRGFVGAQAARMMKRAKNIERRRVEAIDEKKGLLQNIEQAESLKMNLLPFPKKRMVEFIDVSYCYEMRTVISNLSFFVQQGDRIAVVGPNGCGKSTVLKLLLGQINPISGTVYKASGLKISYISQDTSMLVGDLKEFAQKNAIDETIFKTILRQLDFGREQFDKDMGQFSGGQKKKVLLAKSLAEQAHLFVWDEPLNFVDILSRVQMEDLILRYAPTLVFVEHDSMFAKHVATKELRL